MKSCDDRKPKFLPKIGILQIARVLFFMAPILSFILFAYSALAQGAAESATRFGDWVSGVEEQSGRQVCNSAVQTTSGPVLFFLQTKTAWVDNAGINFVHPTIRFSSATSLTIYVDDRIFTFQANPNSFNNLVVARDETSRRNIFLAIEALRDGRGRSATVIIGNSDRYTFSLAGARDALTAMAACAQRERRFGVFGR
jgi:hypothetical protein